MNDFFVMLANIAKWYSTFGAGLLSLHGSYEAKVPNTLRK